MLMVAVLTLALSPFGSVLAYANEGGGVPSGEQGEGATASSTQVEDAGGAEAIADGNTASTWRDWGLENSTENVGRIWTDKTVQANDIVLTGADGEKTAEIKKGDSTFLTALSAISSTSNLKSTSTTPLDIVLVLDASGSMNDPMGNGDRTSRIDALKEAANAFIDEIAKQNAGVMDAAKQHQVAIVKFAGEKSNKVGNDTYEEMHDWWQQAYTYNCSQVMKNMAACTDASKSQYEDAIESISPAGATRSDYGMELAKDQTSGRNEAKKIVVFFTDGKPTSYSNYDPKVAKGAVDAAKTMKDAGASMYTIGIFEGADPSADANDRSTSNENKFMQAASSNYPNATYASDRGEYTWNFGTRAENSDFYKSATNADELKKVFDDISKEIVKDAGYPTETREGYEDESGFITFTDQLGDYMKVDGFTTVVLANQIFENPTKATSEDGLVDTYTFTGEAATALYPSGNLSDIDITVTHSNDQKTGDLVQVKIPAALIPLRQFEVNEDDTGSVTLTFPIRVFYGSSLKDGVAAELANPGSELAGYIAQNSTDGKVSFLANKWSGGSDGDVVANFTPSKGNSYYYITEDTPIYQDEACTQQANAPLEKGKTYYYKRMWYDISNSKATQQTKAVRFDSGALENIDGYISRDGDGRAYFKAGTPRMTYIDELNTAKGSDKGGLSANNTQTASTFINPQWADEQVNVLLGNNGKLSVAQPGTLEISKTLEVPAGYSADEFANDSFEFAIAIPKAANTTLKAQVKNATGEAMGDAFDIAFNEAGNATQSLKNGETLSVYGLAAGVEYTVTEMAKAGFVQTAPADEAGKAVAATGAIEAGKTAHASFTNAYSASGTLNGETALAGEKILTGRDWLSGDKFTFLMKSADASAEPPMPTGTVDGVARVELIQSEGAPADAPIPFNFGNITYTQPGTYVYEIHESAADSAILPGVSTSGALYQVVVTVADKEHNGALAIESSMKQLKCDAGVRVDQAVQMATFTNAYNTKTETWAPIGQKTYTDQTGANPRKADMFHVVVCSDDAEAPLPEGADDMPELGGSQWRGVVTSVEASGGITFPQATYGFIDLQGEIEKTYEYKLMEVVESPSGKWVAVKDALAASDCRRNGMQYDPSVWTAYVTIKSVGDTLELNVAYEKDGVEQPGALFQFNNLYAPEPATAVVEGSKTLTGRDMAEDEKFGFTLSAADKATQDAVAAGVVTLPDAATVMDAKNGEAKGFAFGSITFSKPGTYAFNVSETQWNGSALPEDDTNGLTFDRSAKTVTVTVTDDHEGSLKAEVAYPESGVAFVNQYGSSSAFTGIKVSKTLTGRVMKAGEFGFTIEGVGNDSRALLTESDKSFTNKDSRADGVAYEVTKLSNLTFTQENSGKVYEFVVKEVIPEGATYDETTGLWLMENLGLYYDGTAHTVKISVTDNGKGTVETKTTVDGEESDTVSFTNKYVPTPCELNIATELGLNKSIEGRPWKNGDSFTFNLTPVTAGAPMPVKGGVEVAAVTVTSDQEKEGHAPIDFGSIIYEKAGVYQYRVTEEHAGEHIGDLLYTNNVADITVTVTDDGQGKLTAAQKSVEGATFTNLYQEFAYSEVPIIVTKEITGTSGKYEGQFNFVLEALDDGPLPEGATPSGGKGAIATNGADGFVNFGNLVFDAMASGAADSVAADGAASGSTDGQDVANGNSSADAAAPDAGPNTRTFEYVISEQPGDIANITYDQSKLHFVIKAKRDAQGQITAEITRMWVEGGETPGPAEVPAKGSSLHTFVNTYTPPYVPPVDPDPDPVFAAPSAKKILEGRALVAGEFSFELVEKGKVVSTGTNTATGDITFNPIKYTAPGTHTYTMHEVRAGTTEAGVTYDATTYTVTAKVTKSGGKLQVEYFVEGADGIVPAVFKNVYEPAGATVVIGATKTLAGKELSQGQFTFRLVGADGTVVEATNDANGNVAFPKLSFDKEGTYEFTMTEVKDNQVNVTYDDASYRVVVTVTDDGKGQLVAEVSYPDGPPAFANSYTELTPELGPGSDRDPTVTPTTDGPTAPGKSGPAKHFAKLAKTGDGVLLVAVPVAVGTVAAFAVGAMAFRLLRKRG